LHVSAGPNSRQICKGGKLVWELPPSNRFGANLSGMLDRWLRDPVARRPNSLTRLRGRQI
jgi:hypothetical protein